MSANAAIATGVAGELDALGWRGPNQELTSAARRPDGETVVGGKLSQKKRPNFAVEGSFLQQRAPGLGINEPNPSMLAVAT
jgi:hypothetical protein